MVNTVINWKYGGLPDMNNVECWRTHYMLMRFVRDWSMFVSGSKYNLWGNSLGYTNRYENISPDPIPVFYEYNTFSNLFTTPISISVYLGYVFVAMYDIICNDCMIDCVIEANKKDSRWCSDDYHPSMSADVVHIKAVEQLALILDLNPDFVINRTYRKPEYPHYPNYQFFMINEAHTLFYDYIRYYVKNPMRFLSDILLKMYTFFTSREYFYPSTFLRKHWIESFFYNFDTYTPTNHPDIHRVAYYKDTYSNGTEYSYSRRLYENEPGGRWFSCDVIGVGASTTSATNLDYIKFEIPDTMEFVGADYVLFCTYISTYGNPSEFAYKQWDYVRGSSKTQEVKSPLKVLSKMDEGSIIYRFALLHTIKVRPKDKRWITPVYPMLQE